MQFTRQDPTAMPGPWYLLKTETVGVDSCPVHAEGNKYRKEKEVVFTYQIYFTMYFYSAWYTGPYLWTVEGTISNPG